MLPQPFNRARPSQTVKYLIDTTYTPELAGLPHQLYSQFHLITIQDWLSAVLYAQSRIRPLNAQLLSLNTRLEEVPPCFGARLPAPEWSVVEESFATLAAIKSKEEMIAKIVALVREREEKDMEVARMNMELYKRLKRAADAGVFGSIEPTNFMTKHAGF